MLVVEPDVVFVVIVVFVFMFVFMFELRMFEFVLSLVQAIIPVAAMPKTALIRIFLISSPVYKPAKHPVFFPLKVLRSYRQKFDRSRRRRGHKNLRKRSSGQNSSK